MTEIANHIRMLSVPISAGPSSVVGKVVEVDEGGRVCTVEPINGDALLYDIRLQAEQSATDGVVIIPAVDSFVVVTMLGESDGYVAQCSRVDKVFWTVQGQTLEYTKDGLKLASADAAYTEQVEALLDTLAALIDTLLQFQLSTNMGPTISVMPQVVTALNQHKADLNEVKSKLKTMLY